MYHRFHQRFGTAGVILGVIALIFALAGTALAAKGALTGKQKKEVEKIAKRYAGKDGANGTNGAAGEKGAPGAPGAPGKDGTDGANGESVEVSPYSGVECEAAEGEEGAELSNATGTAYACNGREGSPWTAEGKLPEGSTETGAWSFGNVVKGNEGSLPFTVEVPISFTIPLAAPLSGGAFKPSESIDAPGQVHVINTEEGSQHGEIVLNEDTFALEEVTPTGCGANAENPTAAPGNLCIYIAKSTNAALELRGSRAGGIAKAGSEAGEAGSSVSGAILKFRPQDENARAQGTWAVTGE